MKRAAGLAVCVLSLGIIGCPAPLDIAPNNLPNAAEGQFYSQSLSADAVRAVQWEVIEGNLPQGLSLNRTTGMISGTPSQSGVFEFTVRAFDGSGFSRAGQTTYSLLVIQRLTLDATLSPGRVGEVYSDSLVAEGGVPPYDFRIIGLPAGLALNKDTGIITGTPLNPVSALQLEVTVTDNGDPTQSITKTTFLTIKGPPVEITTESLPDGIVTEAYSQTVSASQGTPPYQWSVTDGVLPDGLSLDLNTGIISGTPTVVGTFNFTITVTDSDTPPTTDAQAYTIEILPSDVVITTTSLPDGEVGRAYNQTLVAANGTEPYTWTLDAGVLPAGLSLDQQQGIILGVPTQAESQTFTVRVTDSAAPQTTDTQALTITIDP